MLVQKRVWTNFYGGGKSCAKKVLQTVGSFKAKGKDQVLSLGAALVVARVEAGGPAAVDSFAASSSSGGALAVAPRTVALALVSMNPKP